MIPEDALFTMHSCDHDNHVVSLQYIPRNIHTVFVLLCFVVVIHWLIFPYPSGLLHWHCGNLTIAPVPAKQPWWIWINTSFEFIMNDYITTTKQSTTKPCAYFLGYTVPSIATNSHEPLLSTRSSGIMPFCRRHFREYFLQWKCLNSDYNFTEVCSQGPNWQNATIGPDNGTEQTTSHYLN